MDALTKCLDPEKRDCDRMARTRGLCNRCYSKLSLKIKRGETSLEVEEKAGRLLPSRMAEGRRQWNKW